MDHHYIKIIIKESTSSSPTEERRQLWRHGSNSSDIKMITLSMEKNTSIGKTSTILDNGIPDGIDQGCDNSSSGTEARARVNLQLGDTNWIFSGFHLLGILLYVSRKFSKFCID